MRVFAEEVVMEGDIQQQEYAGHSCEKIGVIIVFLSHAPKHIICSDDPSQFRQYAKHYQQERFY